MPVIWNNDWNTGIATVDAQHEEWLGLINALLVAVKSGTPLHVPNVLARILLYVDMHFRTEERLMVDYNYPKITDHMRMHHEIQDKLMNLNKETLLTEEILYLFIEWLVFHITKVDMEMASWIKNNPKVS